MVSSIFLDIIWELIFHGQVVGKLYGAIGDNFYDLNVLDQEMEDEIKKKKHSKGKLLWLEKSLFGAHILSFCKIVNLLKWKLTIKMKTKSKKKKEEIEDGLLL